MPRPPLCPSSATGLWWEHRINRAEWSKPPLLERPHCPTQCYTIPGREYLPTYQNDFNEIDPTFPVVHSYKWSMLYSSNELTQRGSYKKAALGFGVKNQRVLQAIFQKGKTSAEYVTFKVCNTSSQPPILFMFIEKDRKCHQMQL